jgi:hypothetical protein
MPQASPSRRHQAPQPQPRSQGDPLQRRRIGTRRSLGAARLRVVQPACREEFFLSSGANAPHQGRQSARRKGLFSRGVRRVRTAKRPQISPSAPPVRPQIVRSSAPSGDFRLSPKRSALSALRPIEASPLHNFALNLSGVPDSRLSRHYSRIYRCATIRPAGTRSWPSSVFGEF